MIEVQGLTKQYRSVRAVDDLSFEVKPGKVTGFLGPNGAGKSTTMRMIVGLDEPTAGSALIHGTPYSKLKNPLRTIGCRSEERRVGKECRARRAASPLKKKVKEVSVQTGVRTPRRRGGPCTA